MSSRHSDAFLHCTAAMLGLVVVLHNIIRSIPDNHVYMCASFFGIRNEHTLTPASCASISAHATLHCILFRNCAYYIVNAEFLIRAQ